MALPNPVPMVRHYRREVTRLAGAAASHRFTVSPSRPGAPAIPPAISSSLIRRKG
jgi:hypothetical protein